MRGRCVICYQDLADHLAVLLETRYEGRKDRLAEIFGRKDLVLALNSRVS